MTKRVGLYIHVPFCKSRCAYCDFFSSTFGDEVRSAYVDRLCLEIKQRKCSAEGSEVATIYWGGGTPSLLTAFDRNKVFKAIFDNYEVSENAEITLEANPDDVEADFIEGLLDSPVNRVSLGVQTFDDRMLQTIGRRHNSSQAVKAVLHLKGHGIDNISIDLIYGLPGQSLSGWAGDLDKAFSLPLTHLSAYSLMFEEGTPITKWRDEGRISEVGENEVVSMYGQLISRCREEGFGHYEISNFAKPGFRSRHNSSYWQGVAYLGFGPGAHSYNGSNMRRSNNCNIQGYISSADDVPHQVELLDGDAIYDEMVMTSLRTSEGIDLSRVERAYGRTSKDSLLLTASKYIKDGTLRLEGGRLFFSEKGFLLSDMVMSDLMRI